MYPPTPGRGVRGGSCGSESALSGSFGVYRGAGGGGAARRTKMSRRRLEKLHRHRLCSMSAFRGVLRGSRGLPGGRRELSGGSSEKFSGPKWIENGAFESDFMPPTRCSVPETTRVLGEIDLSCPISSFRVYDPSFRAANDEPWFENTSNSCVATVLSSFAISLLGGRRMWPQASPIRRPPVSACGAVLLWE